MAGLNSASDTLAIPIWVAFMLAALVAGLCVVATMRGGTRRTVMAVLNYSFFALALLLAWTWFERVTWRDRADERRALEARMTELMARALAPGTPLACLDATAGDAVEDACERALFASPEIVAAAVSYSSARLSLLADAMDFANRGDGSYELAMVGLRRSLEIDRFGFTAQALATRDLCTEDRCDALSLFRDPARVIANLREKTFDAYVGRHAVAWSSKAPALPALVGGAGPPPPRQPSALPNIDFPSAASIPPVSIMNNEPGMKGQTGMDDSRSQSARRAAPPGPPTSLRPANTGASAESAASAPPVPRQPPN